MRTLTVGAAIIAMAAAGAAVAAPKPNKSARSVQLIAMNRSVTVEPRATEARRVDVSAEASVEPSVAAAFRVHDLSRQWVEYQMANGFVSPPGPATDAGDGDPFAAVGGVQPHVLPMDVAPSLAALQPIPLWMRGGSVFASDPGRYTPGCSIAAYRSTGFLRPDIEARRAGFYGMMSSVACEYGIPVGLFDAMIIQESQYQPYIFSPKSAYGLTQLMPGTAVTLGVNRYDIEGNLRGGAKYLRQQLDRFGHYHLALAAYNAGPGRVRNGLVPQISETRDYVANVLLNWSRLTGLSRTATVVTGAAPYPRPQAQHGGRVASVSTF